MSFDANILSSQPVIKAAASMQNDGGAGNLGYMGRGRRRKKGQKDTKNLFDDNILDTFGTSNMFEKEIEVNVKFSIIDFLKELLDAFLTAFFNRK
ncbi:hypothetical protein J6S88_03530 [bacterium]|nr:hypothetical protein [bacterium]